MMHKPAKNRPCGGMGSKPAPKGSAGKVMGAGKPISGGTAYKAKPGKGGKGGRSVMGYGPMGSSSGY